MNAILENLSLSDVTPAADQPAAAQPPAVSQHGPDPLTSAAGAALPPAPAEPEKRVGRKPRPREWQAYAEWTAGLASQKSLARRLKVSRPRVSQILRKVERWIADHPDDQMAARIRVRCTQRLDVLYDRCMQGFADSRKRVETVKDRTVRRAARIEGAPGAVTTVEEHVTRDPPTGDVRFLNAAILAVERMGRLYATNNVS